MNWKKKIWWENHKIMIKDINWFNYIKFAVCGVRGREQRIVGGKETVPNGKLHKQCEIVISECEENWN